MRIPCLCVLLLGIANAAPQTTVGVIPLIDPRADSSERGAYHLDGVIDAHHRIAALEVMPAPDAPMIVQVVSAEFQVVMNLFGREGGYGGGASGEAPRLVIPALETDTPFLIMIQSESEDGAGRFQLLVSAPSSAESQVVYSAEFEGGAGSEWSNQKTETTPIGARHFLGQFGDDRIKLNLPNLPPHEMMIVSLDVFIIRTWDGNDRTSGPDVWSCEFEDGPVLFQTTFNNHEAHPAPNGEATFYPEFDSAHSQAYPGAYPGGICPSFTDATERNTLGYGDKASGNPMSAVYHMSMPTLHSSPEATLVFRAQLPDTAAGLENESWGIDNVEVRVAE